MSTGEIDFYYLSKKVGFKKWKDGNNGLVTGSEVWDILRAAPLKAALLINLPIHLKDKQSAGPITLWLFSMMPIWSSDIIDLTFAWSS